MKLHAHATLIILLLLLSVVSIASPAKPVPLEYFAQLPDVSGVELSPDGTKLASMVRVDLPDQKGISVQVTNLASGESDIVLFSDNSQYVIHRLQWKDNVTLLAYGFAPEELEFRGQSNMHKYKTRVTRVVFVNTETGEVTKPFTPMFLSQFRSPPAQLDDVIDLLPDDAEHVLMRVHGTVHKVNIEDGTSKTYDNQPKHFTPRYTDRQHRLRVGYYYDKDNITVRYYDLEDKKWKDFVTYKGIFSEDQVNILGFDEDPNMLYFTAYHNDMLSVFSVDLSDPELERTLIFSNEKYDATGSLLYSKKQGKVIGLVGENSDHTLLFDEKLKSIQKAVDKAIPNASNRFYSFSDDLQRFLIYSTGPKESGTYYLVETDPLKISAVAYRYKNLPPDVLGPVKTVHYKARDGLEIEAHLTLPNGREAKNLPTIMLPHGGPIARDSNTFDYWAQFFASKGYAVLQMNFRGSSGHGYSHMKSGLAKWGEEMQDDVEDGARYLIEKGIADPERIAIVGASYGGYAALMGAVKTPDFYQCAASVAGVSNVRELVLHERAFWRAYNVVDEQIGNDAKHLKDISPVNHAEKVKIPILLVHGDLDQQVAISHSEQMRDALQKHNKDVEYVVLPNEDHYLSLEDNRLLTFRSMDKFIDKCLPIE